MSDESDAQSRAVILLRRTGDNWQSELPDLVPGWHSEPGDIHFAVNSAREAAGEPTGTHLNVKVTQHTKLRQPDVLALIEANNGPQALDLSECDMADIDLSDSAIQRRREVYVGRFHDDPPWFSHRSAGVNFSGARLRHAFFLRAQLAGADFTEAQLQDAHLSLTELHEAQFLMTNLEGVHLVDAGLQNVDFYYAKSIAGVQWFSAFLDRTRMRREQLGKATRDETNAATYRTAKTYLPASEAYLILKNNFVTIGRYADAAWAYVKERQMEKMAYYWAWRYHGWRLWQAYEEDNPPDWPGRRAWTFAALWLRNWAYELLTGYGERPILPLVWAAALAAVVFPPLYWAIGALPGHGRAFTSWSPSDIDWGGWGDSIIFSLTSFGTLSFSRLQPDGTLPNIIAALEAFTGVLLFALFVFTLGNRMSRS